MERLSRCSVRARLPAQAEGSRFGFSDFWLRRFRSLAGLYETIAKGSGFRIPAECCESRESHTKNVPLRMWGKMLFEGIPVITHQI